MTPTVWAVVGLLALAATVAALYTDFSEILGAGFAMLAWGVWSFGATALRVENCCGLPQTESYPSVALLGVAMTALMLLVFLKGTIAVFDATDVDDEALAE